MADEIQGQAAQVEQAHSEPVVTDVAPVASRKSEGKSKKKIWIIIAIVLVLLLGVGGWFIFSGPDGETDESSVEEITPTRTPTNTPTPFEKIDKEEISIQVLNGTGIAGEATFVKEGFEGLGYVEVEVDNADDTDAVATTATFAKGVSDDIRDEIVEYLEKYYEEVDVDTASSLGGFDVKILLGYRIGFEPSPTGAEVTSTPTPTEAGTETTPTNPPTPTIGE